MLEEDIAFKLILRKIEKNSLLDFSHYKIKCLKRRIKVRLRSLEINSYAEYFDYLQINKEELNILIDTITINVTQFYRDVTAFDFLRDNILPILLETVQDNKIRVWSAGCASGEEVYSIAILFKEFLGRKINKYKLSILGTDIDDRSLAVASSGIYPEKNLRVLKQYYPEYIKKYFDPVDEESYKVKNVIKDMVQFNKRDVIRDPHYMNENMIFCRNLFIYFEKKLQEQILQKFHKDLADGGYLILGKVETILGIGEEYFESLSVKERVYRKI